MISLYFLTLAVLSSMAILCWLYSLVHNKVDIVDTLWSLMFLVSTFIYLSSIENPGARSWIVLTLVLLWSLRLAFHLYIRNAGKPEDRRYQEIRKNNEPGFKVKSLYIVFLLQAVLAWVISAPLLFAVDSSIGLSWIDVFAVVLWLTGFLFESLGDRQLASFQRKPDASTRVLNTGLWRFTRHPNYFGEFCIWWAFYLFAFSAGAWWTIYAPLLMTFLLLRVSGVSLMEDKISHRRPGYAEYIRQTNAFFPWFPDNSTSDQLGTGES